MCRSIGAGARLASSLVGLRTSHLDRKVTYAARKGTDMGEGRLPGLASEDKMARPTALVVQQCCGHHRTPLTFFTEVASRPYLSASLRFHLYSVLVLQAHECKKSLTS